MSVCVWEMGGGGGGVAAIQYRKCVGGGGGGGAKGPYGHFWGGGLSPHQLYPYKQLQA